MIGALRTLFLAAVLGANVSVAMAQEAKVAFGGLSQDPSLPVEVQADKLSVNNGDGSAVFAGNVVVVQGEMHMNAAEVRVEYTPGGNQISRLHATGGVTISNLADAAESREAVYTIDAGTIVMTGDVLLTQGPTVLSGKKLTIHLKDGTGVMEGRVSTTFVPSGN
ncbi:LptA/OstA family protein [Pseudogemmobacter blasticus]|uniref:Lipopolysaccharide transport periplasmic protein LptA n=1 Tax=Fuscovulum blasticum DSM 2131 TaxID=1188250 RepID=A0A2T4JEV5_FUSBL|nr:LptA/OstA family protein [Fuscovulum blasticum]AWD22270.1 lipopolysaccharide transport periplasmic protein LptA [Fuscovulum blasticum]PTE16338.1 lipopolysaccharide transport periplasmic protein LptA [Fuscovulum blasticum DSM 2131]